MKDGIGKLVKWQAKDSLGNGPVISDEYRVLVDTEDVKFSNASPTEDLESTVERVEVGITISDETSGVNGSSIEYSISTDRGDTWSSWVPVVGLGNGSLVNITLNLTFPNGTANRLRWRASDIAGNGPTESKSYPVLVNTWRQTLIPKVKLLAPRNGSVITTTSIELSWQLTNIGLNEVEYDVLFDTVNPPSDIFKANSTENQLMLSDLSDGETYYWTVIPKSAQEGTGSCISGVWSFTVNTSVPTPIVNLISPENGSFITSTRPTFRWSVEYEGSDVLSYEIYLDTNPDPKEFEQSLNAFYFPRALENGTTYYWKVIPLAGNVTGPASEIWSFTVKKEYLPHFELELFILPPVV
ncbi:MAG: hypothetical protein KAJ51_06195, partial [Thermoplasmata archaeon]|nr:hypothetical protein [Thermoplasmata archaeon]